MNNKNKNNNNNNNNNKAAQKECPPVPWPTQAVMKNSEIMGFIQCFRTT